MPTKKRVLTPGKHRQQIAPGERATPERAAKAAVRSVPGDLAGVFTDRITPLPELLLSAGLLTEAQAAAASEYAALVELLSRTGVDSPICRIGMPPSPNMAMPRDMRESTLHRARRLHTLRSAAPADALQTTDGILVCDLFPRQTHQVAKLRRALDAMAAALGLPSDPE
jgi:hypothetical protein